MNFTTEKENIKNNRNGTNDFPLHLGWHKSKNTRGYKEFHKIGDSYYSAFKRYENKRGGYTMCCTNYRSQQCTWTGGMVNNVYSKTDEDILQNKTPQLTNNVSESLNALIKKAYKVGFISKATMVKNLRNFYLKQWEKYQVFTNGEKKK